MSPPIILLDRRPWPGCYLYCLPTASKHWRLNNNNTRIYGAKSEFESSAGLFDECRLSTGWLPTLRPSQPSYIYCCTYIVIITIMRAYFFTTHWSWPHSLCCFCLFFVFVKS